ncbi:MFS transporter [Histidinibacterium aquaticum]|uniref:TCR/Tet family MFS transporter n=1 Tax=Histidinibacterium aquaticum TaxID=2613962 RepID=A0A5J5GJE2_9RHOB|nr:MFS transporter [Histidinibacterium aquaticum]KAA9008265.1 TCR/Tet family MFS transporter [Histidinibacterium aquaticum]
MSRPMVFILLTLLIDAIGIGIVFPILPELMMRVGAGSTAEGSVWGGLLMAAYAGTQFLFAPAVGGLSDARGRKPVLVAALALLALDYVIMALAGSFWLLLLGRALAGMSGATYVTATAYIADISAREDRAANFGLIGAAFGVGFVLGPVLGGLAATWHVTAPFWIAAGLSGAAALFGIFVLPESLKPQNRRPFRRADLDPFAAILRAFRVPELALPLAMLFVFEFANMVYPTIWAFWLTALFGWTPAAIGLSLAGYGLGVAVTQGLVIRPCIRLLGESGTLRLALFSGLAALVGFGVTREVWMVFVFLPFACLADMAPATMTALAANRVGEDRQGLVQGVIAALAAVSAVLAPLAVTAVFETYADGQGLWLPGAPFLFAAVLLACILPFLPRLTGPGAGPVPKTP